MQAVSTGSDEVIRSATGEVTDSYRAIPSKQDQSPFGANIPESARFQDGLKCTERVLCRERAVLRWFRK